MWGYPHQSISLFLDSSCLHYKRVETVFLSQLFFILESLFSSFWIGLFKDQV